MKDKKIPDYYALLRLTPSATEEAIRRQYRILSKRHHPDMGGSHELMAQLNEAYDTLSNAQARALYDKIQQRTHAPVPKPQPRPQQQAYTRPVQRAPQQEAAVPPQPAPVVAAKVSWFRRLVLGVTGLALVVLGGSYTLNTLVVDRAATLGTLPSHARPLAMPPVPTTVTLKPPSASQTNNSNVQSPQEQLQDESQATMVTDIPNAPSAASKPHELFCSALKHHRIVTDFCPE